MNVCCFGSVQPDIAKPLFQHLRMSLQHLCMCVCISLPTKICTHTHMHTRTHPLTHSPTHPPTHPRTHARTRTGTRTRSHTHTPTRTRTRTHTHTYTHTHIWAHRLPPWPKLANELDGWVEPFVRIRKYNAWRGLVCVGPIMMDTCVCAF